MKPRKVDRSRKPIESDTARKRRKEEERRRLFEDAVRSFTEDDYAKNKPFEFEQPSKDERTPPVNNRIVDTIDLHEYTVEGAIEYLSALLDGLPLRGGLVYIIVGKGKHSPGGIGVLRNVIPKWIDTVGNQYIESWRWAKGKRYGGGGTIVARLKTS